MLVHTKGIVFNYQKYRETSIITRIYTEELGLKSYLVNGIRKANTKKGPNIAHFQPLTLLNLVVYDNGKEGLQRISEIKIDYPFSSLPFDIRKNTIGLFLSEILSRTIKEEEPYHDLFNFIFESIKVLDQLDENEEVFHIHFLIRLTSLLGFMITSGDEMRVQLKESFPGKAAMINAKDHNQIIESFMHNPYGSAIPINGATRRSMIEQLIAWYQLHVEKFGEVQSLSVLKEVMNH